MLIPFNFYIFKEIQQSNVTGCKSIVFYPLLVSFCFKAVDIQS